MARESYQKIGYLKLSNSCLWAQCLDSNTFFGVVGNTFLLIALVLEINFKDQHVLFKQINWFV